MTVSISAGLYARKLDGEVTGLISKGTREVDIVARILRLYDAEGSPRPTLADVLGYVRAVRDARQITNGTDARYPRDIPEVYPPRILIDPAEREREAERERAIIAKMEELRAKEEAEQAALDARFSGPMAPDGQFERRREEFLSEHPSWRESWEMGLRPW